MLPPDRRPMTLMTARGGTIGSEDLARALDDAGRLTHSVWLRLDAADRDTAVFAHAVSHALDWVFPNAGAQFADELTRAPGSAAPEGFAHALASVLAGDAVVVLEDDSTVMNTRAFARFGDAWSMSAVPGVLLVVVVHGRPGRQLLATIPSYGEEFPLRAAADHAAALALPVADELVRVAAGRAALVKDVADAASAERIDLVTEIVTTSRNTRDLVTRLTDQLLASVRPDEIDALGAASQLGYWHPDLGSSVVTANLRPWLLPLQDDWHWLRPIWAAPLARGLRRFERRRVPWWTRRRSVAARPVVSDAVHQCRTRASPRDRLSAVAVWMLGPFELAVNGRQVTTWHGHLGPSVLKYLLAQPKRASPRDVLLDVFWPEVSPDVARNRLQVALSGVRRSLQAVTAAQLIEYRDGNYFVGLSLDVERDIDRFEQRIESGRQHETEGDTERSIKHFKEAVALYRGDFLEDSPYEEWAVLTREALRVRYLDLLDRLARLLLAHDRVGESIDIARRIVGQDPCREDAHRHLMRCFVQQGQPQEALRQFDLCQRTLRDTMDVDPAPATLALYRSLQADAVAGSVGGGRGRADGSA
jgi:DNA-binding SARP family transcriptional activator